MNSQTSLDMEYYIAYPIVVRRNADIFYCNVSQHAKRM